MLSPPSSDSTHLPRSSPSLLPSFPASLPSLSSSSALSSSSFHTHEQVDLSFNFFSGLIAPALLPNASRPYQSALNNHTNASGGGGNEDDAAATAAAAAAAAWEAAATAGWGAAAAFDLRGNLWQDCTAARVPPPPLPHLAYEVMIGASVFLLRRNSTI